ncbi:Uncharacterised protein [Segatella copri]|nr:Uncharacterised protein [Segatella copri]
MSFIINEHSTFCTNPGIVRLFDPTISAKISSFSNKYTLG